MGSQFFTCFGIALSCVNWILNLGLAFALMYVWTWGAKIILIITASGKHVQHVDAAQFGQRGVGQGVGAVSSAGMAQVT